jgi:hypothetical protein
MVAVVSDYKDGFSVTGAVTAGSPYGPYSLLGGKYLFTTTAPSTTLTVNIRAADGTYIALGTSTNFTTSAGTAVLDLPPCQIEVAVSSTSVGFSMIRIPYRTA